VEKVVYMHSVAGCKNDGHISSSRVLVHLTGFWVFNDSSVIKSTPYSILWLSRTSLFIWSALLTRLATQVQTSYDELVLHLQWWVSKPSLASEAAESCHEAEDLHCTCPGSRPSRCRNLDSSWGRFT